MGSKVSSLHKDMQITDSDNLMALNQSHTNSSSTAMLFRCCKSPTHPTHSDTSDDTEFRVQAKRAKRSLNFNASTSKNKENRPPYFTLSKISKISPCHMTARKSSRVRKAAEKGSFLAAFFRIFDDDLIQDFLWMDSCYKLSDKYLLSMVYTYFRRANLTKREYNRINFFSALYLSHDMEEDNEDLKLEIFPWVLGNRWRSKHLDFMAQRDFLLQRMSYRAAVSKTTCDEVMALCPTHPIWRRERKEHHGGAERVYDTDEDDFTPRGPNASPLLCVLCEAYEDIDDISSPTFTSGYLSSCSMDITLPHDNVLSLQESKSNTSTSAVEKNSFEDIDKGLLHREE